MISPRPHSPLKLIHMARRHALLIVIPAIIVAAASAIAIKQLPDLYESSARVTIEPTTGGAAQLDPSRRLGALRQQITSRARLEELISKHNLYPALKNSGASADEIVNRMRSDIRIEADSEDAGPAYSFTISYRANDTVTAQKLTAELAGLPATRDYRRVVINLAKALGAATVLLAILFFALPVLELGRGVFLVNLGLTFVVVAAWRKLVAWSTGHPQLGVRERVLILGSGKQAIEVAQATLDRRNAGFHVVGFADNKPELIGKSLINPSVIGLTSEVAHLVESHQVDRIVVAVEDRRGQFPTDELLNLSLSGRVAVEESACYYERLTGKIATELLRPSWLIFARIKGRTLRIEEHVMSKPTSQLSAQGASTSSNGDGDNSSVGRRRSPLADLVSKQLRSKGLRQIDFCRQTGFDQGLLSKILSSVVNTLNVETALKLADGLNLPPAVVFEVIGKKEVDELLRKFYCNHDSSGRVM